MAQKDEMIEKLEEKARKAFDSKHNQLDLFVADLVDASPKSDAHSMEHPMFALGKKKDLKIREYKHGDTEITITPSVKGMATIWDKDILIYCASQIAAALNKGEEVGRTIRIDSYALLTATERSTGGKSYDLLVDALGRLEGTRIKTTIKSGGLRETEGFGFIDRWKVAEVNPKSGRMVAAEIEISRWLFRAFASREVFTLNRDYFRLKGGLERSLYLIARKHVGEQEAGWIIRIDNLHKKAGVTSSLSVFKKQLEAVIERDQLPDYTVTYEGDNCVRFSMRGKGATQGNT